MMLGCTIVCGPDFSGHNCIDRAVCVFSFRFYLVFDVLVYQVKFAVFALIGLSVPDFRNDLKVKNMLDSP